MRRSSRWTELALRLRTAARRVSAAAGDDGGSAALEFIAVGVLMLVPLVYLVIALGAIQGQSLGVEAAARHAARVIATSPDARAATTRADAVLRGVVDEYDIDASTVRLTLDCRPAGAACPSPGATLTVTVAARVPLPLVPPVLGLDRIASIPVEAFAVQKVSRLGGSR